MKTETTGYSDLRQRTAQKPVYILQPYHVVRSGFPAEWPFTRGFSSGPISAATREYLDLLGRPQGNTQTAVPEEGQSSLGTFSFPLQDSGGEILRYLSNPRVLLANALTGAISGRPSYIEGQTSIGGYPAIGTLQIGSERVRYHRRDDATNRFSDLEWAIDGTSPSSHLVGDVMQNGEQLRAGQRVQLLAGYRDLDERSFLRFAKMEITTVGLANDGLTYILAAADIQKFLQRLVFPATQQDIIDIVGNPLTVLLRLLISTGTAAVSTGTIQLVAPNIVLGTGTDFLNFFRPGDIFLAAPFSSSEQVFSVGAVESDTRLYVAGDVSITPTDPAAEAVGPNRVVNGDFNTSINGWTTILIGGATVVWTTGRARLTANAGQVGILRQEVGVAASTPYAVEFVLAGVQSHVTVGSVASGTDLFVQTLPAGQYRLTLESPTQIMSFRVERNGNTIAGVTDVDQVKIRTLATATAGPIAATSAAGLSYRRAGRAGLYDVFNGSWSVGMPEGFIDVAGIEALRDEKFSDSVFRYRLNSPEDAKDFIEKEVLKPLNAYPFITQDGQYACRVYEGRAGTPVATLDEDQIIGWTWQGGEDRIINQVEVQYDWNEILAPNMFGVRQRYTAAASVEKYGLRAPFKMASKGLRSSHNVQGELDRWAFELFQRYSDSAPRLQLIVRYGNHVLDIGETVAVTHARIPDRLTGSRGLVNEPFQIRDVRPTFGAEGRVVMTLIQVSALDVIDQPTGDPSELARTDLVIARASFFNAASVALTTNEETLTGSITVTLTSTSDSLHIQARQYVTSAQVSVAPTDVTSRIRIGSVGGTLLDGIMPSPFLAATATAKSVDQYARRGVVTHEVLHSPGITGNVTVVMSGFCPASGGAARDRSMTVTVRRI